MSVMDIIEQCIREKEELRDKELKLKDVRKAIENNKFKDLILNKIYPELMKILKGKENCYPTYYRIDAALASEYKLVPVHGVFVFLRPDIRTPEQFKSYFGYNSVDEFLEDVKEKRIIPMIGWIDENEETYKPYTTGIYKELFEKWSKYLEDIYPYPLCANRIEYLISKGLWTDIIKEQEEYVKELIPENKMIDFEEIDKFWGREYRRERLPRVNAVKYFAERLAFLSLFTEREIVNDIKSLLIEYKKTKDKKWLYLAADYTFFSHQFITAHLLYSKGFASTITPSDLLAAIDTFKKIIELREDLNILHIYTFLFNIMVSIKKGLKRLKEIIIPKLKIPEVVDREISNEYRKDEKIQTEIKEARIQITELFDEIQNPRPSIDNITKTFEELEQCIKNLSEEYERRWARTRKMVLTCFGIGVNFGTQKISEMVELDFPFYDIIYITIGDIISITIHELVQRGFEKIEKMAKEVTLLGKFVMPIYCWKKGIMEKAISKKLFSQMQQM